MSDKNDNTELITIYESLAKDEDLTLALKVNRGMRILGLVKKIEAKLNLVKKIEAKLKVQQEGREEPQEEMMEDEEQAPEPEPEPQRPVQKPKTSAPLPFMKPKLPTLQQVQKQMKQQQVPQRPMPQKQVPQQAQEDDDFPLSDDEFP